MDPYMISIWIPYVNPYVCACVCVRLQCALRSHLWLKLVHCALHCCRSTTAVQRPTDRLACPLGTWKRWPSGIYICHTVVLLSLRRRAPEGWQMMGSPTHRGSSSPTMAAPGTSVGRLHDRRHRLSFPVLLSQGTREGKRGNRQGIHSGDKICLCHRRLHQQPSC